MTNSPYLIIIDIWADYQRDQGNSERTVEERARTVRVFARHLHRVPTDATADEVQAFMGLFRLKKPCTRATYFGHLKAWFAWLIRTDRRDDDPCAKLRAPKFPRRRPRPVSDNQLARLLATPMHRRTHTMILLAAFQGLRVHEIAKIRGCDVDVRDGTLHVVGKGEVDAVLPLHPLIAGEAARYPQGYWFSTYIGNGLGATGPILPHSVTGTVSLAMTRAGIDGGAHRLRHWYGSDLVDRGVNIRIVQELLRHASLQTTQIYTQVTLEQQRRALHLLRAPERAAGDTMAA